MPNNIQFGNLDTTFYDEMTTLTLRELEKLKENQKKTRTQKINKKFFTLDLKFKENINEFPWMKKIKEPNINYIFNNDKNNYNELFNCQCPIFLDEQIIVVAPLINSPTKHALTPLVITGNSFLHQTRECIVYSIVERGNIKTLYVEDYLKTIPESEFLE